MNWGELGAKTLLDDFETIQSKFLIYSSSVKSYSKENVNTPRILEQITLCFKKCRITVSYQLDYSGRYMFHTISKWGNNSKFLPLTL